MYRTDGFRKFQIHKGILGAHFTAFEGKRKKRRLKNYTILVYKLLQNLILLPKKKSDKNSKLRESNPKNGDISASVLVSMIQ